MAITALEALTVWGLRSRGGANRNVGPRSVKSQFHTSSGISVDDELDLVCYVERIKDFEKARPILVHVYVDQHQIHQFRNPCPGHTYSEAIARLGWQQWRRNNWTQTANKVHAGFVMNLEKCLRFTPWYPPERIPEPTADDVVAAVEDRFRERVRGQLGLGLQVHTVR